MAPDPRKASLWAIAAALGFVYLAWGSTYLAIRIAIESIPPLLMAGTRNATAGLILLLVAAARGRRPFSHAHLRYGATLGFFMVFAGNGGLSWSEQFVPSATASLVIATIPLWILGMEAIRTRSVPRTNDMIGLACGILGIAILTGGSGGTVTSIPLVALAVLLTAALMWAFGSLRSRGILAPEDTLAGIGLGLCSGGAISILAGFLLGEGADLGTATTRGWLAFTFLVFFGSVFTYPAYIWLFQHVRPYIVSTYAFVNPLVAIVIAAIAGDEHLGPRGFLAAFLICAAVAVSLISFSRRAPRPPVETDTTPPRQS